MDLDKKAKEILNDKLNEHKHRMAEALFGSTEEMVLDVIKQALTITDFRKCYTENDVENAYDKGFKDGNQRDLTGSLIDEL